MRTLHAPGASRSSDAVRTSNVVGWIESTKRGTTRPFAGCAVELERVMQLGQLSYMVSEKRQQNHPDSSNPLLWNTLSCVCYLLSSGVHTRNVSQMRTVQKFARDTETTKTSCKLPASMVLGLSLSDRNPHRCGIGAARRSKCMTPRSRCVNVT